MNTANAANIGGKPPTPRGRYHSGRIAESRRLGAGTLTGATLKELQLKMETKVAEREAQRPVDDLTAEIRAKEKALKYEMERQAALKKRLELDEQLKALKIQNDKMSQKLGDAAVVASTNMGNIQEKTRFGAKKKAVPAVVPRWLKYEKFILRFRAWSKEKWFDSIGEGFSVRKFVIAYYMADKSVEVIEPKIPNSGTTGGVFMKRTVISKKNGEPVSPSDLAVGMRIPINGRVFTIYDCESETRKYMQDEFPNVIMSKALALPNPSERRAFEPGMGNDIVKPVKVSKAPRADHSQFLNMDGKILEFIGIWDDTSSLQGEIRKLKIKYFLVDDTMEVSEMTGMNSGRDLTSRFRINRGKLAVPEAQVGSGVASFTSAPSKFYKPQDLIVGSTVTLFGRVVSIVACNTFARTYFNDFLKIEVPQNAEGFRGSGAELPGYKFTSPTEVLKRLQFSIRSKIEVKSNYGTVNDQQRVLRHMFAKYDSDNSGSVSKEEFFAIMQAFALFGADSDTLFSKFDKDGNGSVSIDEFVDAVYDDGSRGDVNSKSSIYNNVAGDSTFESKMAYSIDQASKDDSNGGLLVLEESLRNKIESMANFSTNISRKKRELENVMKRYDTDGSGALSFQEFRAALSQLNFRNRDADMLFRAYDADGNGQLNYAEFSTLLLGRKAPRIKVAFQGHNVSDRSGLSHSLHFSSETFANMNSNRLQKQQWYPQQGSKQRNTKTSLMHPLH